VYRWLIAAGSRLPLIGAIHFWSINPRGPGRRLAYKRRQHAPFPALPVPGARCCEQYHTVTTVSVNLKTWTQCVKEKACARNHSCNINREHNTFADIIQHSTLTSRFHDTQTFQYTTNLTIEKIQSMKLLKVQPIPLSGVSFSQSSKLEHLFCHVSVKREVRAVSFELETAFENVTPTRCSRKT